MLENVKFWNLLIALAYYLIPTWLICLWLFKCKNNKYIANEVVFIALWFVLFILACGTGHFRIWYTGHVELAYTITTAIISLISFCICLIYTYKVGKIFDEIEVNYNKNKMLDELTDECFFMAMYQNGRAEVIYANLACIRFCQRYGNCPFTPIGLDWLDIFPALKADWINIISNSSGIEGYTNSKEMDYWASLNMYISWRFITIDANHNLFSASFFDSTKTALSIEKLKNRNKVRYERLLGNYRSKRNSDRFR